YEPSVFAGASAVCRVISSRGLAVVPENLARGGFGNPAQMWVNACYPQVLAMRSIASVKTIERVPAAEVHGESARGHRHGLQRLVGDKVTGLARQHSGDVLLHRHERGDEQTTVLG